jgi:hypothetical protein
MRRSIVVIVMALSAALASTASAQVPTQDSVTGSGTGGFGRGSFGFQIDAHSGPSGESPTGTASLNPILFGIFEGPVTCLAVDGNAATLNFVVTNPSNPADSHVFTFTVMDLPTGDRFVFRFDARAPTDCSPLTSFGDPIASGAITVVDARPLPIAKHECLNGGWKAYGIFKNQGDCVSFVATQGKNPPTGP